eukprot:4180528-Prorocentrum_lima.AAC.1
MHVDTQNCTTVFFALPTAPCISWGASVLVSVLANVICQACNALKRTFRGYGLSPTLVRRGM